MHCTVCGSVVFCSILTGLCPFVFVAHWMCKSHGLEKPLQVLGHAYVWGDVLPLFDPAQSDVRVINLETSVTHHSVKWPQKAFNYRMAPENLQCLTLVSHRSLPLRLVFGLTVVWC